MTTYWNIHHKMHLMQYDVEMVMQLRSKTVKKKTELQMEDKKTQIKQTYFSFQMLMFDDIIL